MPSSVHSIRAVTTPVCLISRRANTSHGICSHLHNLSAKRQWHWSKKKFCFLNLHHTTKTCLQCVSNDSNRQKKYGPFSPLIHSETNKIKNQQQDSTQSHTNDALNCENWTQSQVRMEQTSFPLTEGGGEKPLTHLRDLLYGENMTICCQTQKLTSAHTHLCWKRVVLGFKWACTVFTYPPVLLPGWRV